MNSALFEKLALLGKAEWITVNIGTFDAATIKVPDNGFLLLKQIIYNHFNDSLGDGENIDVFNSTVHGLSIYENGSQGELYYNLRSGVTPYLDAANKAGGIITNPITIIDTWKIFTKSCCVELSRVFPMSALTHADGKFEVNAEERPRPLGFGNVTSGINVQGAIQFPAAGGKYFPNGDQRKIAGLNPFTAGAGYRDQFRNNVGAGTKLNPAPANATDTAQNMAPFITLGFWKVSGSPSEIAKLV